MYTTQFIVYSLPLFNNRAIWVPRRREHWLCEGTFLQLHTCKGSIISDWLPSPSRLAFSSWLSHSFLSSSVVEIRDGTCHLSSIFLSDINASCRTQSCSRADVSKSPPCEDPKWSSAWNTLLCGKKPRPWLSDALLGGKRNQCAMYK